MDNKSLWNQNIESTGGRHSMEKESRNSQSRRKIWKSLVVNEIRQQGYAQRILQQTAKR